MQNIIKNPTPGSLYSATASGTVNNATPTAAQGFFNAVDSISTFGSDKGGYNNSPVTSYVLNNGSVVVNVTMPDHPLHPGYVARDISNGVVNNRGEGGGFLQSDYSLVKGPINGVWDAQTGGLIKNCGCTK